MTDLVSRCTSGPGPGAGRCWRADAMGTPRCWTARFGLLIRHDYAGREFAYDAGSEKALAKAKERGWTMVSMQNDFKVVFDL